MKEFEIIRSELAEKVAEATGGTLGALGKSLAVDRASADGCFDVRVDRSRSRACAPPRKASISRRATP